MNPENKMTILVVDDDEVVGRVLSRVLTQQGHLVWQAQTASQAMSRAREHSPRLALLDLCLPDGDGLELARQLRQDESAAVQRHPHDGDADQRVARHGTDANAECHHEHEE